EPERRAALGRAARRYAKRMLSPQSIFDVLEARLAALAGEAPERAAGKGGSTLPEVEQSDV
ncbi:MAG TPA: colanic acid biosynthesis glycosyltransferase WcaI, partial [Paraburkholderia sp.]